MSKYIILIVILASIGVFFSLLFILKVKTECRTQYGKCPDELVNGMQKLEGGSLYQTKKTISKSLKNNFLVLDFSTQFKFPNILFVNVLIKKPSFMLKNDANQTVAVSQDGKVLDTQGNASLPTVIVFGNLKKPGQDVEKNQLFALDLVQGINEMYQVNIGKITDDGLVVELPTNFRVLLPLDGDVQVLLGSLRLVYLKVNNMGKYNEIDLRFKNPVLR